MCVYDLFATFSALLIIILRFYGTKWKYGSPMFHESKIHKHAHRLLTKVNSMMTEFEKCLCIDEHLRKHVCVYGQDIRSIVIE